MSRKALGSRLSSAHKLQRNWNDWQPRSVAHHTAERSHYSPKLQLGLAFVRPFIKHSSLSPHVRGVF